MPDSSTYVRKSKRFPLYRHSNGSWCKRIKRKLHYFGQDKAQALERYNAEREAFEAGRLPSSRASSRTLTVRELLTQVLRHKNNLVDSGDLTLGTYRGYAAAAELIRTEFGDDRHVGDLQSSDFADLRKTISEGRTAKTVSNLITCIRVFFNFAYDEELIDRPIRFKKTFAQPKKLAIRKERDAIGDLSFASSEIRNVLQLCIADHYSDGTRRNPDPQLYAMILIAIQSGMGNADLGCLKFSQVDLKRGWINCPRNKNANPRRFPLWPETIAATKAAIQDRPTPISDKHADFVFITRRDRRPWHVDGQLNSLGLQFRRLLERLKIYRKGRSFYSLRRTFETIASEVDQVACSTIMGHVAGSGDMSALYRQHVKDERLQKVVDHVHGWLFGAKDGGET